MSASAEVADISPVRKNVTVKRTPEDAFDVFTAGTGRWWPRATHSVSGDRTAGVEIEPRVGGRIGEIRDDGERIDWGRVLVWDPPRRLVVTWHPGLDPERATELEIRFVRVPEGTRVELEHRGWARLGEAALQSRNGYDQGWEGVFVEGFARACA